MAQPQPPDVWAQADAYERYIGRWSRLVAAEFVGWLRLPSGARWLDVGCGSGALTEAIVSTAGPSSVLGIDQSRSFIAQAQARLASDRVTFEVGDAGAVPAADGSFEAVVAGLVLNFVPDPAGALREWRRVATPGATLAAYVWDYAGQMELLRYFWDAAVALDLDARALDEGVRFPLCNEHALRQVFSEAGLLGVDALAIDVPTTFIDFDDFWQPFLGGQGPAASYTMSLTPPRRDALRERIRSELPVAADGSISLHARAWAIRGQVT